MRSDTCAEMNRIPMSARKATVRLSRRADQDFLDLLLYTRRTWGEVRKAAYRASIVRTLRMIAEHPFSGHSRDDFCFGCRAALVEQHVIYYHFLQSGNVEVLRILHRRQDPTGKVEESSF